MGTHVWSAVVVALAWGAVFPASGAAQEVELSLGAGWFAPGGEDFADTDAGPGTVAGVRWRGSGSLALAVGAHWSIHGVDFTDDKYDVVGVFVEPRWEGGGAAAASPFVGVRLAWARKSIRVGDTGRSASGFAGGGIVGLRLPLSDAVSLEGAAGLTLLRFGDFTAGGRTLDGTESSGRAWSLEVGLTLKP